MSDIEAGAEEPNELPVSSSSSSPAAVAAPAKPKGRDTGVTHGLWVAALALANVLGAALLFYAVGKGVAASTEYDSCNNSSNFHQYYPSPSYPSYPSYAPSGTYQPVNPYQPLTPSCHHPVARTFWGLVMAPFVALVVSSVLMTVLYARRRKLLAIVQTGFFVIVVGTSLVAATTLLNSGF